MDFTAHWRGRDSFTIFDPRFGSGERFRAALAAWRADPGRSRRLHYIGIAESRIPGARRIPQDDASVTLDLLDGAQALPQLDARIDAVLDGLAADDHRALARLFVPGTLLFQDNAGYTTFKSRKPVAARNVAQDRRAIVLGAGLAGSAACERLCARGWQVTLVERHAEPALEASGNLAGIYMPLLSKDDNIPTRLARAAFLFALDYWKRLDGIEGARCGVIQLARDAAHAGVQRAIAERWHYPHAFAQWLESAEASAMLGAPAPDGAWLFPQGGWARPASVCTAMLAACAGRLSTRFGVGDISTEWRGGEWHALDAKGRAVARAPVLVLAGGTGATALAQTAALPLARVRGQVSHLDEGSVPALPFVLCREAYLTPASHGVHSAGATYDLNDSDTSLRQSSHDENLAKVRSLLGDPSLAQGVPLRGRVGFRCVAPDRLPLVGAIAVHGAAGRAERLRDLPRHPGLHGLLGYASRGLIWAPLAAELLAAQLEGEPLPLERKLVQALDPARFMLGAAARHAVPTTESPS